MSGLVRRSLGQDPGAGRWSWRRLGGVLVSTTLTLTPHRRCASGRNRSIPTISAGPTDVGPVDVSAVDTEAWDSPTPRGLGGGAGCSRAEDGRTVRGWLDAYPDLNVSSRHNRCDSMEDATWGSAPGSKAAGTAAESANSRAARGAGLPELERGRRLVVKRA